MSEIFLSFLLSMAWWFGYSPAPEPVVEPDFGVNPRVLRTIQGGTSTGTPQTGGVLYADGSNVWDVLPPGTDDQVLTLASGLPSWADATGGAGGTNDWEFKFDNAIGPTTTPTGLYVTASSTFSGGLRIDGNATTTATSTAQGFKGLNLISCDTIDTDAAGHFMCGTDDSGGNVGALGDLSDVSTTTAATGNVLVLQADGTYDNEAQSGGTNDWQVTSTDHLGGSLINDALTPTTSIGLFINGGVTTTESLSVDGTTLVVDSDNNEVGIGIANPEAALTVFTSEAGPQVLVRTDDGNTNSIQIGGHTNANYTSNLDFRSNRASGSGLTHSQIRFVNVSSGNAIAEMRVTAGSDTSSGIISFWNDNNNRRMTIDEGGNVGVATSTPERELTVEGSVLFADTAYSDLVFWDQRDLIINPGGTARGLEVYESDSNTDAINLHAFNSGGIVDVFRAGTVDTRFNATGGDSYINLAQAGEVGFGTSTPTYLVTIEGDDATTGLLQVATTTNQTILIVSTDGRLGVGTDTPDAPLEVITASGNNVIQFESDGANSNVGVQFINDARTWQLTTQGSEADRFKLRDATGGADPFQIEAGASDNALYIDSNGDIGIGDASPGQRFTVGAELFTVDSSGNASTTGYFNIGTGNDGNSFNAGDLFASGAATTSGQFNVGDDGGTATTTHVIGTTDMTNNGGCLIIRDTDGAGFTYCSALNGTLTCSSSDICS